jgi:AraC-like DNA-binding protein
MEMSLMGRAGYPQTVQGSSTIIMDVRRVLRTELLRDRCSAAGIARLFSMHRRTMSRHLRTRGLTFRHVANEVRFEIACELLANTDMTLSQVAAVLRYSELSAFTRAFRRWCGKTPSEWRTSHPAPEIPGGPGNRTVLIPNPVLNGEPG